MARTPHGRVKFKVDNTSYSVLTIWKGDKGYSISVDKHSPQYPAMNPIEVFKRWAKGEGFLDYFPANASQSNGASGGGYGGNSREENTSNGFADDDIPF